MRARVEAVKNKTAPPFRKAEFIIAFGKGIDNEASFFDAIIEKGLVQTKGAGWYSLDGKNIAQGTIKLKEFFEKNPEVYNRLKKQVIEGDSTSAVQETSIEAEDMTDNEIGDAVEEEIGEFPEK